MDRKIYAIIVAGGSGSRMGADVPKQFLRLSGKCVLRRTIENFVEAVPDVRVITVLPPNRAALLRRIRALTLAPSTTGLKGLVT